MSGSNSGSEPGVDPAAGLTASNGGSGGVSRGPGSAPLTWGQESDGDTSRFEPRALPQAGYRDPENSAVAGVGAAAPDVDPVREASGAVDVGPGARAAAWKRRLAPHHRDAVRTFFSREGAEKP